jgi:hypothetical protein
MAGGVISPLGRADRGSGARQCAQRGASRSPAPRGQPLPDRALRSGQGRPQSRRPPIADPGSLRGAYHDGCPRGEAPSRPRRTDDDASVTAAGAPARRACAPGGGAAARAATRGSRGAIAVGARARPRREPHARRGSSPAYEAAGDGVHRVPAGDGARRAGPESGPRAHGPSDDLRRGRDIGWTGTDGRPGQDGWRTRVRRCDSVLSTWSPAVGGLTRPDTCRTTSKRMGHSVSHRGCSEHLRRAAHDVGRPWGAACDPPFRLTADRRAGRRPPPADFPPTHLWRQGYPITDSRQAASPTDDTKAGALGQAARIRLFLASCVSSARPSASSSGGMYIPNRPR